MAIWDIILILIALAALGCSVSLLLRKRHVAQALSQLNDARQTLEQELRFQQEAAAEIRSQLASETSKRQTAERELGENEARFAATLEEKEVLLKEIHHRVKNNLQIISSLLNLQSRHVEDKLTLAVIRESQNRVKSIALIHELLYQSADLARIDIDKYVQALTTNLLHSHKCLRTVEVEIETHGILLNTDLAIPCGLIINELATNSIKHAFPNEENGSIRVELSEDGNQEYLLRVSDNGIGFPANINFFETETLGLRLVSNLSSQLNGKIDVDCSAGTSVTISFVAGA